jgi:hypothetical protein
MTKRRIVVVLMLLAIVAAVVVILSSNSNRILNEVVITNCTGSHIPLVEVQMDGTIIELRDIGIDATVATSLPIGARKHSLVTVHHPDGRKSYQNFGGPTGRMFGVRVRILLVDSEGCPPILVGIERKDKPGTANIDLETASEEPR